MKKSEIQVGGKYVAKVSGKLVTVRVDAIREYNPSFSSNVYRRMNSQTHYDVTNLSTGRKTTFRSAAKFRSVAVEKSEVRVAVIRDCCISGNCDKCSGVTPYGKCLTVTQTGKGGATTEYAEKCATNWKSYNARIVTVAEAEAAQKTTDDLVKAHREEQDRRLETLKGTPKSGDPGPKSLSSLFKF